MLLGIALTGFISALGLINDTISKTNQTDLIQALLFLVSAATIRGLFFGLQTYIQSASLIEFESKFRKDIVYQSLISRRSDISKTTSLFHDILTNSSNFIFIFLLILSRAVIGIFIFFYLLFLSPYLTIASLILMIVILLPYFLIDKEIRHLSKQLFENLDSASKILVNGLKNSLFLHIQNTYINEITKAHKELEQHRKKYLSQCKFSASRGALPVIIGTWMLAFITALNYFFPTLEQGQLITYFYLFIRCIQMLGEIALQRTRLNLHYIRFRELWIWWNGKKLTTFPHYIELSSNKFPNSIGWEINNVSHTYKDSAYPIIINLTFSIKKNSCCVITGSSGKGKSTLLNLLLSLETPTNGTIIIEGDGIKTNLNEVKNKLLNSIGYVGPESYLIAGTIKENLLYGIGQIDVSEQKIEEALTLANCPFVFDFPDSLNHKITEQGEGLSAGQKQRLMLARALLRDPKALFLDEATANLDAESEEMLLSTLSKLKKSITIVAVTHKPAFLKISDQHLDLNKVHP